LSTAAARPLCGNRLGLSGAALWRSFLFQSTESIAYCRPESHLVRRFRRCDAAQNKRRPANPSSAATALTTAVAECVNPPLR
jgi:hypothetical protein